MERVYRKDESYGSAHGFYGCPEMFISPHLVWISVIISMSTILIKMLVIYIITYVKRDHSLRNIETTLIS